MELLDFCFCRPFRFAATGKNIGHAFDGLTLPRADLVRMNLMLRRYFLDRLVTTLWRVNLSETPATIRMRFYVAASVTLSS